MPAAAVICFALVFGLIVYVVFKWKNCIGRIISMVG